MYGNKMMALTKRLMYVVLEHSVQGMLYSAVLA